MKQRQASQREAIVSWLSVLAAIVTLARLLLKAGLLVIQRAGVAFGSAEYEAWRRRFLLRRLKLVLQIALLIATIAAVVDFATAGFSVTRRVLLDGAVAIGIYGCLVLRNRSFGRTYPGWLFLALCWGVTLIPSLEPLLEGELNPNLTLWTLTFLLNALLIPVCWSLHLVAQLGVILAYVGAKTLWQLSSPESEPFKQMLYLFWVCFICDLSVYLHERLQRNELEYRDPQNPDSSPSAPTILATLSASPQSAFSQLADAPVEIERPAPTRRLERFDRQLNQMNSWLSTQIEQMQLSYLRCQPLNLSTIIQAAIAQLEPLLIQRRSLLVNTVSTTLPLVSADPSQLKRVFEHLVRQCLAQSHSVNLTLRAEILDADEGSTIPLPAMIRCILQENGSDRSVSANEWADADDLTVDDLPAGNPDLTISEKIIRAHGGRLGITQSHSQGTTVWFTLPIATSHQSLSNLSLATDP